MGETVDDLIARMDALLPPLEADGDPRRFFLGTYLRITRAVAGALGEGLFEDPAWVEAWDVDFAGLYLDALEAHRRDPATAPAPWRRAFGASPTLRPEGHVLLGVNAHINFDLPQSLVRVIPTEEFADPDAMARRRRDHERIDGVLASRVATEDVELQRAGDPRTWLDRLLTPVNHLATRVFLRESRRKVWANTTVLHRARLAGDWEYRRRLAELETLSDRRVADLLRPGPVLLRLAVRGFGVQLAPG
ncbi:DUF5995 family protein [Modestobacter altitudinis]|uniref:DUF5995 family protein n=1 Tax=Modestobacter altitudinis TaxID=2213158 RepID=UPI00110CEC8B|nr:DUF5995 family protein [Modestobacter altitudinis]